ncbi:protein TolQ [Haliangium sp.]|uniref:protein TolQ n=1 Tax=Haliangium sp. TaxID=2663208 RepID=UPI003D0E8B84
MPDFLLALAASDLSLWNLVAEAHWVVKGVMSLLAVMSIFCWYIIGHKYLHVRRATQESKRFLDSFWRTRDIDEIYKHAQSLRTSPISAMFLAGYTELAKLESDQRPDRDKEADLENVERALHRAQTDETTKLETLIPFLATTGSSAPFIGLFGTVFGIMNSFSSLGEQAANIKTVAPGIAEALFATAIGLVAAIPAVIAYNYFQRGIRVQVSRMNTFEKDYLNIVRRHFLS